MSCALPVLVSHVPRTLRALALHVFRILCVLVPHLDCAQHALVSPVALALCVSSSHVPRALPALVLHVSRALCSSCSSCLTCFVLYLPLSLTFFVSCMLSYLMYFVLYLLSYLACSRVECLASFICQYHLFSSCFPMLQ